MDGDVATTTTVQTLPGERVVARLRRRFKTSPWAASAEMVARLGYMARGVVYLSIGLIALLTVARVAPHTRGALGSMEAWAHWRAGVLLLWLTGIGLWGFAGWRALQSLFDADGQGRSLQALGSRLGQGISGLIYGAMAASVFDLIDALHDIRHQGEQAQTRETIAAVLAWPMGSTLVMALGAFIVACGLGNIIRAGLDNFGSTLRCDPRVAMWACRLARVGYFGRGAAMLPVGFYMLAAGWHARASEAMGVGGALWAVHRHTLGDLMLAPMALGLVAFGAFAFVEAWHRPIRPEAALRANSA
jgi:hypothetical protein